MPGGIGIGGTPIGGIPGMPAPAGMGPTLGVVPKPGPDAELLAVAVYDASVEFLDCDAELG